MQRSALGVAPLAGLAGAAQIVGWARGTPAARRR
jgi:hypothetical protein